MRKTNQHNEAQLSQSLFYVRPRYRMISWSSRVLSGVLWNIVRVLSGVLWNIIQVSAGRFEALKSYKSRLSEAIQKGFK